jgi:hypothetical protein
MIAIIFLDINRIITKKPFCCLDTAGPTNNSQDELDWYYFCFLELSNANNKLKFIFYP